MTMKKPRHPALAAASGILLFASPSQAVEIQIDYSYDTSGFFNDPERRAVIEAAAAFYSEMLDDTLLAIDVADFPSPSPSWDTTWNIQFFHPSDPFNSSLVTIVDPVIPQDVIRVYVGAADLGGSLGWGGPAGYGSYGLDDWKSRVRARGNPGANHPDAQRHLRTDFAPAAGSISFDIHANFNNSLNADLQGFEMLSVALHELGHVLGIGTADSWDNPIAALKFNGPVATRAASGSPSVTADGGSSGFLKPTTDLDLAALADIGWEVRPPLALTPDALGPVATTLSFPSISVFDYTLERSTTVDFASPSAYALSGDGRLKSWNDPSPPATRAFYRLRRDTYPAPVPIPLPNAILPATANAGEPSGESMPPRRITTCGCASDPTAPSAD
jgi:hypothetical protein